MSLDELTGTVTGSWRHRCWHGTDDPPPELADVRAGALTAVLDGVELRYVRRGDREILRRIYPTVRDANWKVVPISVTDRILAIEADSFAVEFRALHVLHDIRYEWHGAIRGSVDGALEYTMRGTALADFEYNRIGFVVLHPELECAGRPYRGRRSGAQSWFTGQLPERIAPQVHDPNGGYVATSPRLNELAIELDGGLEVQLELDGELFEMEDQRNWDNSLKTFCTPLSIDYPHSATTGNEYSISVRARVAAAAGASPDPGGSLRRSVKLGPGQGHTLPAIGFGLAGRAEPLSASEVDCLRMAAPDHLRIDLHLGDPSHEEVLERALTACATLDAALELCLHADAGDASALDRLAALIAGRASVARVLVWQEGAYSPFHADTTPSPLLELVRERLRRSGVDAPVAYGSEVGFAQINKTRPDVTRCDALYFAYYALVHTGDDLSLCETFPTQREMIRSTRAFGGAHPIAVSPITFSARRNYYAPPTRQRYDFDRLPDSGGLPRSVDPRQMSLFGAGWTLGTLEALSGADSLTFYETTGWRGLMEDPDGPALPDLFPSRPGMVFPLFYVFADLADFKGGRLLDCRPTHPLETAALAVARGDRLLVLVANLTPREQAVELDGLAGLASIRLLDETSEPEWSSNPAAFHRSGEQSAIGDGPLGLRLAPYGLARVIVTG
jgi:hypothetical protein